MASASLAQFTGSNINVPNGVWEMLLSEHGPGFVTTFSNGDLEKFLWHVVKGYQDQYGVGVGVPAEGWEWAGVTNPGPDADLSVESWIELMMDQYD